MGNKWCLQLYRIHKWINGFVYSCLCRPCVFSAACANLSPFMFRTTEQQQRFHEICGNLVKTQRRIVGWWKRLCALKEEKPKMVHERCYILICHTSYGTTTCCPVFSKLNIPMVLLQHLAFVAPDKNILSWFGLAAPLSRPQTRLQAVLTTFFKKLMLTSCPIMSLLL